MRVTQRLIEALSEKKQKGRDGKKLTNTEIAEVTGWTPQHIGRILAGQIRSVDDERGHHLLQWLGLEDEPPVAWREPRRLIAVRYTGTAMRPMVQPDEVLYCEMARPVDLEDGDIVAVSWKLVDEPSRRAVRYWRQAAEAAHLYAENRKAKAFHVPLSRIQWIARAVQPTKIMTISE